MSKLTDRLKHAWNVFNDRTVLESRSSQGFSPFGEIVNTGSRPDRLRMRISNERSIIASIYTRIAIDFASVSIRHVKLDDDERFQSVVNSGLNDCLKVEANLDQAGRMFRQDIVLSLFEKGVIAIVPVETSLNPNVTGGYDIRNLRVGEIVKWYPRHVRVNIYNEKTGRREEVTLEKSIVAIVENPLYLVMNEPNSTLQRLMRKLSLLDVVDEQSSSGKLDLIIQLPYVIRNDAKKAAAEQRRRDIEFQLKGSQYGIAYTDGTEKITQLNRPAENNLLKQVEYLTQMLYAQLGITEEILNGTADEVTMLNYYNRTIEPLLDAVVEEFRRKFLTKTARTQGQSVQYYRDPFKFVPVSQIAEISDKFTRNEIATSNEMRGAIGWRPHPDPKADELRNSNMPAPSEPVESEVIQEKEGDSQNGS